MTNPDDPEPAIRIWGWRWISNEIATCCAVKRTPYYRWQGMVLVGPLDMQAFDGSDLEGEILHMIKSEYKVQYRNKNPP